MKLKHDKINVFAWRRAICGLEIKHLSRSRACQAKVEFPERWRDEEGSQSLAVSACCPLTNAYQARSSGPIAQFWIQQQEQNSCKCIPPPWQIPLQAHPHKPKTPIGSYLVSPYCFICHFLVPHCCSLPGAMFYWGTVQEFSFQVPIPHHKADRLLGWRHTFSWHNPHKTPSSAEGTEECTVVCLDLQGRATNPSFSLRSFWILGIPKWTLGHFKHSMLWLQL